MIRRLVRKVVPISLLETIVFWRMRLFDRKTKRMGEIDFLKEHESAMVLGTGPSLKQDLDRVYALRGRCDTICVNHFCRNREYSQLKPNKYIFLDKYFFADDAHPDWVREREATFDTIDHETTWKMQIFIPKWVNYQTIRKRITNPNVEIIALKVFQTDSRNKKELFKKYDSGLFGPYQGNVLNYAIYIAIWCGYSKIRLFGCDLSLHLDLEVDQANNNLNLRYRYFGKEDRIERFMKNPQKSEPQTMSSVMTTAARTFAAHAALASYAEYKRVKILNCASFSLIDSYPRERRRS